MSTAQAPLRVFDRAAKLMQRSRAARDPRAHEFFYLRNEIADRLTERVLDITKPLPHVLDIGCGAGAFIARALQRYQLGPTHRPQCKTLICTDASNDAAQRAKREFAENGTAHSSAAGFETQFTSLDEESTEYAEQVLRMAGGEEFDLVLSCMNLHWVNDLGACFRQVGRLLRPDGVFMSAMIGGETLRELRVSMQLAEEEIWSGVSPHISPMVQVNDIAALLTNHAGLAMPTIDSDVITVVYKDVRSLMHHLQGMGESNCVLGRRTHFGRLAFQRAEQIYKERFGVDENGHITASFHVFYMIGWKPHETHPQPARRGSQQFSLRDLSDLSEKVPRGT